MKVQLPSLHRRKLLHWASGMKLRSLGSKLHTYTPLEEFSSPSNTEWKYGGGGGELWEQNLNLQDLSFVSASSQWSWQLFQPPPPPGDKRKSSWQVGTACNSPCWLLHFLGKPAEKIAYGGHMIAGHLVTSHKCKRNAKYSDCGHRTAACM